MNNISDELTDLRQKIDAIDEEVIKLILARSEIVSQVGEIKQASGANGSFIRPKRESDMIKKIVTSFANSKFSAEAAANIWRNIIGASLAMESPLNIAVHCPDGSLVPYFMAREYFGSFIPTAIFPTVEKMINAVEQNQHSVGIVSLSDESSSMPWWIQLALSPHNANIFTCVPFVQRLSGSAAENPFVAIGQVEVEQTDSDISYLVAVFEYSMPRNASGLLGKWLKDGDFRANVQSCSEVDDNKWAALIKLSGFAKQGDAGGVFEDVQMHLNQVSDGSLYELYFIGSHATPCLLD